MVSYGYTLNSFPEENSIPIYITYCAAYRYGVSYLSYDFERRGFSWRRESRHSSILYILYMYDVIVRACVRMFYNTHGK